MPDSHVNQWVPLHYYSTDNEFICNFALVTHVQAVDRVHGEDAQCTIWLTNGTKIECDDYYDHIMKICRDLL